MKTKKQEHISKSMSTTQFKRFIDKIEQRRSTKTRIKAKNCRYRQIVPISLPRNLKLNTEGTQNITSLNFQLSKLKKRSAGFIESRPNDKDLLLPSLNKILPSTFCYQEKKWKHIPCRQQRQYLSYFPSKNSSRNISPLKRKHMQRQNFKTQVFKQCQAKRQKESTKQYCLHDGNKTIPFNEALKSSLNKLMRNTEKTTPINSSFSNDKTMEQKQNITKGRQTRIKAQFQRGFINKSSSSPTSQINFLR